jgi:predicted Zn-dependent peptidase
MKHTLVLMTLLAAAAGIGLPAVLHAQEPLPANPFGHFQALRLQNGLRVWYGHLPGSEMTSMAVVVPAGRDMDPRGREQTAHLLEHVLLGDRAGHTEAELLRELTLRGGVHGGYTTASTTVFPVSVPAANAAWALQWLSDVVTPRWFGEHEVARHRTPVAMETGARPRGPAAAAAHRLLRHPLLRPPPFWQREFGLDVPEERSTADHALFAISAADLQRFHDTWYAPATMTLVVVSGIPSAALLPVIETTFGMLPWRPAPQRAPVATPRTAQASRFAWTNASAGTTVGVRYRFADLDARDRLRLVLIEDMLRYRLMDRLRRGDDKAVYSVDVSTVTRAGVGFLGILADVAPGLEADARAAIEGEIARLVDAPRDPAFDNDRDLLSRRLRTDNAATAALLRWAADRFAADESVHEMPDLGEYYAAVDVDSIAALARRLFVAENLILHVTRPLPVPIALLALLAFIPIAAAVRLMRRLTLQPADMRRIRYVTRLRPHPVTRLIGALAAGVALLAAGMAAVAAAGWVHVALLAASDSFALHVAAAGVGLGALALLVLCVLGAVPRKVLVFDDELRIKSATYRSHVVPRDRIRRVEYCGAPRSARLRYRWFPPAGHGVCVSLDDGSALFLQVRDHTSLAACLAAPPSTALALRDAKEHEEMAWAQHTEGNLPGLAGSASL